MGRPGGLCPGGFGSWLLAVALFGSGQGPLLLPFLSVSSHFLSSLYCLQSNSLPPHKSKIFSITVTHILYGWFNRFQALVCSNCQSPVIVYRVQKINRLFTSGHPWNNSSTSLLCRNRFIYNIRREHSILKRCYIFLSFVRSLSVEGGRVYIRDWRDKKSSRVDTKRKPVAPGALKTRPCWFHDHHPQRCPLQAEHCAFAHGPDDLRPSTRPLKWIKNDAFL